MLDPEVPSHIRGPRGVDIPCSDSSDCEEELNMPCEYVFQPAVRSGAFDESPEEKADAQAIFLGVPRRAGSSAMLFSKAPSSAVPVTQVVPTVSASHASRSPERQLSGGQSAGMDVTPPRRRKLLRRLTEECPPLPQELQRGQVGSHTSGEDVLGSKEKAVVIAKAGSETPSILPVWLLAASKQCWLTERQLQNRSAHAWQQKFEPLTPDDAEYRMSLTSIDQGLFLDVNRRSRSRSPPYARA